jgi:hypothetical protein
MRIITISMMFILLASVLPASADEGVSRSIYPHPPSEFDVMLTIHNISIAGIVEILPEDASFISTMHQAHRVSGNKIAFAAINDTSITYRIRSESTPEITGMWEDFLNGVNGTVNGGANPNSSPRTQAQKSTAGFEALLLIAVLLYLFKRR